MFEHIKLDNGLNIYLIEDKNKHVSLANLIVNFGGYDDRCLINNKKIKLKSGLAHFLEHVVLESSKYGDMMNIFGNNGVRSNGLTTIERTEFYIDTTNNFYDNLSLLLKGIHSPILNKDKINDIRKPILEEKIKSLDNKYSNLYNANLKTYLDNNNFKSILGDLKDIKNITNKDLELAFNTYYRPNNEILVISGNFDKKKVLETIENVYNELEFKDIKFKRYTYKEKDKVNKKHIVVKGNTNIIKSVISYKINIKKYTGFQKLLLDTYIYSFLRMNFGTTSKLNKELIDKKIIIGNIGFITSVVNNHYIIRIEGNTNDYKLFQKIILDYFKKKDFIYDKELFDNYKKGYIIDTIIRNDNIYNLLEPFIQNIIFFNYEGIDKVSDIENMNFKEFKKYIKSLDFNNYSITELRPK